MKKFNSTDVAKAVEVAAKAVGMSTSELHEHCILRTAIDFSKFLGEEPGGYRPSFYDSDNSILADAYDAGREYQGDPRRSFRGRPVA